MNDKIIDLKLIKKYNKHPDGRLGKVEIRVCKCCKEKFGEYKTNHRKLCFDCTMGVLESWKRC